MYEYFFYFCDSDSRDISLGILYGYKAVLQVVAFVFSFSIRKVKIKGLNDAKSIALAVYVTSIVTAVILVSFYSLKEYLNIYATLFCLGFFIGTTAILCLIFIPKVNHSKYSIQTMYTANLSGHYDGYPKGWDCMVMEISLLNFHANC